MVDYEFYSSVYHGGAISADDWAELEARAVDQLRRYKRIYTVTAPDEQAEGMAVCAMAEALHNVDLIVSGDTGSGAVCLHWLRVYVLWQRGPQLR